MVNKFNGYLVPFNNYQVLAKKVMHLADNKDLMKKFGENGRRLVEEKYSKDEINSKIIALLKET